jgi:hypothetical protein
MCVSVTYSQVQIFEQGQGGLVPYIGLRATPDLRKLNLGAEYNIEGKFSLGFNYRPNKILSVKTASDTLFQNHPIKVIFPDAEVVPTEINPYFSFELLEPDKLMPISFSFKISYSFIQGEYRVDSVENICSIVAGQTVCADQEVDVLIFKHKQHVVSGGPMIGWRFYIGPNGIITPLLSYEFNYFFEDRFEPNSLWKSNHPMRHDINAGVPYSHMFNEHLGIMADPKLSIAIGTEKFLDMIFNLNVGLVLKL